MNIIQDVEPDAIVDRDDTLPADVSDGKSSSLGWRERASQRIGEGSHSMQDRMFSAILSQMFPNEKEATDMRFIEEKKPVHHIGKPPFSLPTMSSNFRAFNARIGVVFAFQARAVRLFSWTYPTHTFSFLAVYTLVCLNPHLLIALPLAICLLFIMVPAYLARHPAPTDDPVEVFDITGPASAPPAQIKPAPEMSKDFFRNMRDLQNSMGDFSFAHDLLVSTIGPVTNFSDEKLSSAVFLGLSAFTMLSFIASNIIPFRATFLILGWAAIGGSHPLVKSVLSSFDADRIQSQQSEAQSRAQKWMRNDIILDEAPEAREVEVFELQRQSGQGDWEPWLYSPSPFTPLSPSRISGHRPTGTPFFEDVKAPRGWEWKGKKWNLDMMSRDWVEERMITAVEVETEGERWVYDIQARNVIQPGSSRKRDSKIPRQGWEESTGANLKGDWRRRRWVRLVKRKVLNDNDET